MTPFRILFRQYLFRMVDLELLSHQGDMSKLLGQFAALLIFLSTGFAILASSVGSATGLAGWTSQMVTMSGEHFMIATTMLVVGLFAVLSWDSTFPNRRDVFVLAPLPVRTRTLFLAKIAAVGAALAITITALHILAGLVWPAVLHAQASPQPMPALTYEPALPPVSGERMEAVLNRDLAQARQLAGALAPGTGAGAVAGILDRGVPRIFAYGTAKPDSIFEIGSISKTFTALILAQMVTEEKTDLGEPVRSLLPPGTVATPSSGREINLLDLATHHSNLPSWPDNLNPADKVNPFADYGAPELYAFLSKRGVIRPQNTSFSYSNYGYSLLATALANRAEISYPELLKQKITGPLGLRDTVVVLSAEQEKRLIQGYGRLQRPEHRWDMDAMAGAGGIRSTASDILTFLEAQLHPEKLPLGSAIRMSHQLRAKVVEGNQIALAWMHSTENGTYWQAGGSGTYWHNGGTGGYSSYAFFCPARDYAAVVLFNQHQGPSHFFADRLGEHIRQRLAGEPAISLDNVAIPSTAGVSGLIRTFAAYWITMFTGGAFIFSFVLGLQGLAAQLLPRRWFLRVSSFLQMATFCVLVSGYMLQPILVTPPTIVLAQNHGPLFWSPSYWFLGLFQQLNGSPALAPLARRAWVGLLVCFTLTAVAYLLSYFRTLRKIVEEPDIVASVVGWNWLPRFGNRYTTAVTQFSIRSLFRSRQHRMILAFYWGIAFAFVIFIAKSPGVQRQMSADGDIWRQPNVPLLVASAMVLCAAIVGIRVVAAMPLELRANWIFQVTPVRGGSHSLAAVRRAVYILGLGPVWLASAVLFPWLWPWQAAVGHLTVLALLGIALTELCLSGFHKIPFTCSYLPGKSQMNMAVLGFGGLVFLMGKGADFERRALGDPATFAIMTLVLGIVAAGARWRTSAAAESTETRLQFEEEPSSAIFALNLHRDGVPPT